MMAKLDGVKTLDMVNGEITKVAYGGAEYERVEGEAEVGDIVLITTIGWTDAREGEFYKAVGVDSDGDAKIKDDRGTIDSHFRCNYDLFRKVAAINPSVEERVAKAEGEIESLKSDVAALKGAAEYKRIAKSEARAGDYVKFDEAPRGYLTAGKYYEIDYVDSNGDPYITDDAGDVFDTYCLDDDEFEVYRKVSAESVEAEPKPERLKVGDYAKVVKNVRSHEVEVGTLLLVTAIDNEPPFIKCDELSGNRIGWFYEDELVRATDDEVAEAKRAAKWAEIGREVGEYKKGDFVKLTLRSGDIFFGEITEHRVGNTYGFKHLHAEYGTTSEYSRDLTLVTPVEARFDR